MRVVPAFVALALLSPLLSWAGPVNINSADAATLAKELKGIGPARAQAIVEYRNQHGPFKSADELTLVRGIAQKVVDENRASIRVEAARAAAPAGKAAPSRSADARPAPAPPASR